MQSPITMTMSTWCTRLRPRKRGSEKSSLSDWYQRDITWFMMRILETCNYPSEITLPEVFWVMKLNPQQAPLYGDSVLTVLLTEEDKLEDDVVFYLLFAGSTLKHLTSTKKVDSVTLKTVTPGHDCCETVKVSLCASKKGLPVLVVAEETFQFVQDEAYDAAQFLAASAGNQQALIFARFLDRSRPPLGDVNVLDEKVALAFRHLKLPEEWNVLGTGKHINDDVPQESLMHFAVRLGLLRLAWLLLQQPGGRESLNIHNNEGATPVSLALERGFQKLHQLLTDEKASEPDVWSTLSRVIHSGDPCIRHHSGLNVYTLTESHREGTNSSLDNDIGELRKHIQKHSQPTNATMQSQPEPGINPGASILKESAEQNIVTDDAQPKAPNLIEAEADVSAALSVTSHTFSGGNGDAEIKNTVESKTLDNELSLVVAESSCDRINIDLEAEKEEVGRTLIVASENTSDKWDCTESLPVALNGVEILPSCGNASAEAERTLTGIVSTQEGLCDIDSTYQEVKPTREGASVSVRAEEAADPSPGNKEIVGNMGQAESNQLAESLDGELQLDCDQANKQDSCTTLADSLEVPACKEDAPVTCTVEPTGGSVASLSFSKMSGTVAQNQAPTDPDVGELTHMVASCNPKNEAGVSGNITELKIEETEGLIRDLASVELSVQKSPHVECDGKNLLLTNSVQTTDGETTECENMVADVKTSLSGEHIVLAEVECTPTELTEPCNEGHESAKVSHSTENQSELAGQEPNGEIQCHLVQGGDKTVTVSDTEKSSKATEDSFSKIESTRGSDAGCSEKPEPAVCKTGVPPTTNELSPLVDPDSWTARSAGHELEGSTVQPVLTEIEPQLVQKQTITACESGIEQELPCLTVDFSIEPSASNFVQPEVAQEMELGFVSFLSEEQQKSNAESRAAAPLAGDEAPLQSEDEVSTFNKSKHVQDGLIDTPSRLPNNPCEVNQEVDTRAADFTEQASVRIENALSAACQGEKGVQEESPSLPAVREGAQPKQVLCETEAPSSDKLSSHTGLESPALIQGPEPDMKRGAPPDVGLEQGVSHQETDSVLAVDAEEGATNDVIASTTDVLQTAGNDNTLASSLEEECTLVQSLDVLSPRDVLPASTAALVDSEGACEALNGLPLVDNTEEEEEEEEDESESVTIPRISLHPIAEEPLSDSDSSADMTSSSSESDRSPIVKEFTCNFLKEEDEGNDRSNKTQKAALPPSESTPEFMLPHGENAAVMSFVNDLIGSVEAEDSINTTSMLTGQEPVLDMSGACTSAASAVDTPSPEAELQCTSLSEPISPGILATSPKGEGDSGLELSEQIDDDLTSPGGEELESVSESLDMKCQDEVDFAAGLQTLSERDHLINRDSWCSIEPCPGPQLLQPKHTSDSTECGSFLEDGLGSESTSSHQDFPRNSGSDSDIFHLSVEGMDDMVFAKTEEEQSAGDITSSSSSADDTTSLERTSSRGSDISLPRTFHAKKHKNRHSVDSSCSSTTTPGTEGRENGEPEPTETEGEEMDSITEVPLQASLSRHTMRSLSPFRRHSWGPGKNAGSDTEINQRSYSLEGLAGDGNDKSLSQTSEPVSLSSKELSQPPPTSGDDCSSFLYLNKGDLEARQRESRASERLERSRMQTRGLSFSTSALSPPLTKSMSLVTIHQPGLENQGRTRPKRRISFSFIIPPLVPKSKNVYSFGSSSSDEESDSTRSLNSTSSSLAHSISEESCNPQPSSPSRKDLEGKGGTKVSRTFSYIKNKMSSKKTKEKDKDKTKEKDKDCKEKDKKTLNGHHFTTTPIVGPMNCQNCMKLVTCKDAYLCSYCNSIVHKGCRESYTSCAMVKMKQTKVLQAHDTSSLPAVIMRTKSSQPKERPRSAIVAADENTFPMHFSSSRRPQTTLSLSKSVSIQNIAGAGNDENHLNTNRFLSRSTDSLNKMNSKVTESMESLNDEGTDMNEGQLMGDFEMDSKQLEAESWSQVVDSKFLRQHKKDVVKRQDVIYELMQTEMHHVRTLKIMSDVYSRGMATELQFEPHMVEKIFPCLDDLLKIHNQFFQNILDRKRESMVESSDKNFVIKRIGDLLMNQFSGENAERMKKTYGKFCGHHNEAVNYFKDLHAKEKRFQAFMKKKMSSSLVRRLGIPECILLVTQRITKYPVLLQRILQYTKENDVDHTDLAQSLILVKDTITAVNDKVNNYEKKMRLHEIYSRTDSKSIQRMKGGKMFAKEDLKRRKLVRDGPAFLKTAANRLKEVQAVLLSDTLVFLQEKDQKYVFASLEQKSTVISLKRLIVRDVAHEEKGLFLISMGEKDPEMVEVHASSKDERNSWIQVIQDTMNTMGKDEDEGVPSESEEERKMMDIRAKELKERLQEKDKQILTLLDEKENIFRYLCHGQDDGAQDIISRGLFRASSETLKGEELVKTAIKEVESLQGIVSSNLGGTLVHQASSPTEPGVVGPVSLPRRAETFGGFDSHQMTTLKNGEKDEVDENLDLRRTESDGVLKKGANANFMLLLKRNSEQVLCSVSHLHELLSTLQAVVVQQDSCIEDQKMVLNERSISRTLSKPNSLIEQEKQRSLEKQRQELANLQKQQTQHLEEKRKREREWEARERELAEREARIVQREELAAKGLQELEKEREELQARKEEYQRDLERLRTAQKQLEKETEQLKRDLEQDSNHDKIARTSSMATESSKQPSSSSPKHDHLEPVSPKKEGLFRTDSKQKGKGPFHLLSTTNQTNKPTDRLFNLSKPKEKKEKKKKSKGGRSEPGDCPPSETGQESEEIFC